jgi:hypothetical protein
MTYPQGNSRYFRLHEFLAETAETKIKAKNGIVLPMTVGRSAWLS